jgi:predicted PurR-regulated permease PerM
VKKRRVKKKRPWRYRLVIITYRLLRWAQRRLPPGVRSLLGLVLCAFGFLGFLPILGFWMIPLGIALVVADFPPLRRRLEHWLNETRRRYHMDLLNKRRNRQPSQS